MIKLLCIAAAGALGTLARFGLAKWIQESAKGLFPWGTLGVNLLGCLCFGLCWTILAERFSVDPRLRTIVLIGFMGAFTTFSSFAFETAQLLDDGQWALAAVNVTAQNVGGLLAMFAGMSLGKLV